ncbi:MAG TPA: hypothetical protein DEP23_06635 [Ruminococcaceae bacterium]|nr:hypothetical protein [Oscillospiraceae bacterium]
MFFKVIRYDLKNGFVREFRKFIIAALIFLILCFDFYLRSSSMRSQFNASQSTFADYLLYIFMGIIEYKPKNNDPFQFPALWMLIMLLVLYIVLYYPYKDLMGYGKQVLINAHSRSAWWLSKCCWLITSVAAYFLLLYGIVLLFCLVMKIPLSLHTSEYLFLFDTPPQNRVISFPLYMNLELFLLPFLLITSVGLMQMFLSLIIRPLYSYCVSVTVMLASTYYLNFLMLGNYAMMLRSSRVVTNGVYVFTGLVYILILAIVSIISGLLLFRRYDILNKEQD